MSERLSVLFVSQAPPSPPRYGAQVRVHGLMTALAAGHDVSVACCADPELEDEAARALRAYCRDVVIVREPVSGSPLRRRLLQLRALASTQSFERRLFALPELQRRVLALLARRRFDVVVAEGPFVAHHRLRAAPPGAPPPRVVLDEHNVEFDVHRQIARSAGPLLRRLHSALDGWKMQAEEHALWSRVDAIAVTSRQDAARVLSARPRARVAVVPNGVDVARLAPRPGDPPPDRSTLLFFGALDYYPNQDGLLHFLDAIWPRLRRTHPALRLRVVGRRPPPALLARRGPGVEIVGFVEDLRPSLAAAGAVIVPLRLGGGTRLKILEAMAMGKALVSTSLGAEGIDAAHGRELLLADDPERFAGELRRVLDDPALAARLGAAARRLVEARHSWASSAASLERCLRETCAAAPARAGAPAPYGLGASLRSRTVTE